ncbi:MAG: hypothetical protein M1826_007778 [Phylliscum demangeonii]|nr:MAG: hypothetical protein M1826_007778 [Phylliscum demangeonii]
MSTTIDNPFAVDEASSSSSNANVSPTPDEDERPSRRQRPKYSSRKSSGTMIVDRDSPNLVVQDGVYGQDDARGMSPRRSSKEVEQMGREIRQALQEHARTLQAGLMALVDRVEMAKIEYQKLEGENRFLQSYIGELIATSKITATGPGKSRPGRSK